VSITVNPVNDAPVARSDSYVTDKGTTLTSAAPGVLGNDTDADGNTLSATLVSGPAHAAGFSLNPNGSFTYTPTANYTGADTFTYRASDGRVRSAPTTVTITVNPRRRHQRRPRCGR